MFTLEEQFILTRRDLKIDSNLIKETMVYITNRLKNLSSKYSVNLDVSCNIGQDITIKDIDNTYTTIKFSLNDKFKDLTISVADGESVYGKVTVSNGQYIIRYINKPKKFDTLDFENKTCFFLTKNDIVELFFNTLAMNEKFLIK